MPHTTPLTCECIVPHATLYMLNPVHCTQEPCATLRTPQAQTLTCECIVLHQAPTEPGPVTSWDGHGPGVIVNGNAHAAWDTAFVFVGGRVGGKGRVQEM